MKTQEAKDALLKELAALSELTATMHLQTARMGRLLAEHDPSIKEEMPEPFVDYLKLAVEQTERIEMMEGIIGSLECRTQ